MWDAWGRQLLPDAIVNAIFDCASVEGCPPPVWIGVEEDGLNEFLLQPIRTEQVKRGTIIPYRSMRAPRGKLDFIGALQPYFKAKQVLFAKELPELRDQLLGYPTGRIDAPNALAYALKLKPGAPIHDNFNGKHVFEGLRRVAGVKPWLAISAISGGVGAALVQYSDGVLYVIADWFREGRPVDVLPEIVREAQLECSQRLVAVFPPAEFQKYSNQGIVAAARQVPMETQSGAEIDLGTQTLSDMLQRERRGFPCVRVSSNATWTLNGFAGGYCRYLSSKGVLEAGAETGPYSAVVQAIESFVALTGSGFMADREDISYDYTPTGRRYITARR